MSEPTKDHTLEEAAKAIRMSPRWVRDRIKDGVEGVGPFVAHTRRGHKITFTDEQLESLRGLGAQEPVKQSVTTGRKRSA